MATFNSILVTVASNATPVAVSSTSIKYRWARFEVISGSTKKMYLGDRTLVVASLTGLMKQFAPGDVANGPLDALELGHMDSGPGNELDLSDLKVATDTNGGQLLVTYGVG